MDIRQALVSGDSQTFVCTFDEEKHEYRINGRYVPGASKLLEIGGYVNKEVFRKYPNAAIRGKAVHLCCELLDENDLDWTTVTDEGLPYVMAYEKFLRETGFMAEKEWTERRMFDTHRMFGGTLDRRGRFPNAARRAIVDLKTGAVDKHGWVGLQTALYELLMPTEDGPFDRYALRLKDTGDYKLIPFEKPTDRRRAIALVEDYWEKVEQGIVNESGELKWKIL